MGALSKKHLPALRQGLRQWLVCFPEPPFTRRAVEDDPPFLRIAASLHTFEDHVYLAGPAVFVQKIFFTVDGILSLARQVVCP